MKIALVVGWVTGFCQYGGWTGWMPDEWHDVGRVEGRACWKTGYLILCLCWLEVGFDLFKTQAVPLLRNEDSNEATFTLTQQSKHYKSALTY